MEKYLIMDISIKAELQKNLEEEFGVITLDSKKLTNDLLQWHGWKNFDPMATLIVLPGNGASIVKKYINNVNPSWLKQWPLVFSPNAKRVWVPGEDPQTFVERIEHNKMILGIDNVMIIDDVISSGSTIQHLRKINSPWIPNCKWNATTWIMQRSASTKGFSNVMAIETVGTGQRAPVNSLSTLIEYENIAKSYAKRNFEEKANVFLEILKGLR